MGLVETIKELSAEKKMTLAGLEREVGISNGQIRKWDESTPGVDKLQLVADHFHVSIDYLLGRTDNLSSGKNPTYPEADLANMIDVATNFDGKPINEHDKEVILAFLRGKYDLGD